MYLIGAAVTGLFGFLYFGMLDTALPSAVFIAIVLSLIPHDMMYGPQAALIAEAFTPRLRYSGCIDGVSACLDHRRRSGAADRHALFAAYHTGYAISIYIAGCAVISLVAAALMPDYTGQDISANMTRWTRQHRGALTAAVACVVARNCKGLANQSEDLS